MIAIEKIARAHLPFVQAGASHPTIGAKSNVPFPYPENGAELWYAQILTRIDAGLSLVFAVVEAGEFCGVISLNGIDRSRRTAELDYWIVHGLHGRGIATAAAGLAIQYARDVLEVSTLWSGCLKSNAASIRVLEKSGFVAVSEVTLSQGRHSGQTFVRFGLWRECPS